MILRLALIVITLSLIIIVSTPQHTTTQPITPQNYHSSCPWQPELYKPLPTSPTRHLSAIAVVVPHHLLASSLIHEILAQIDPTSIKTVVLIGPNHHNQGIPLVQTTKISWKTPSGPLIPNLPLIDQLIKNKSATIVDNTFTKEHSICGLVGFIPGYFPQASLVPLVLRPNISLAQSAQLGEQLAHSCTNCLLIASVDFTHESSSAIAKINDTKSAEILTKLDANRLHEVVADSLPSLQVVMSYARARGATKGVFIDQADSNDFALFSTPTVTSYVTILYPNQNK